ncbi:hypothetical protein ACIG5E_36380 [Kitasatospora sp. NPDC053057]|uniref:hypothetical protein n=1 Tax=Kitasatospora sp. NPDC053057 TaxID=3364062 RepID=UPI0037CA14DD
MRDISTTAARRTASDAPARPGSANSARTAPRSRERITAVNANGANTACRSRPADERSREAPA